MCAFCDGKKKLHVNNGVAFVEDKKFLVVKDGDEQYVYDLGFCPECGEKLNYWETNRVYVSNITKDEVLHPDFMEGNIEYAKNPLHHLICDKGFKLGELSERQVDFIVSEVLVNQIKKHGYCDLLCWKGYLEH